MAEKHTQAGFLDPLAPLVNQKKADQDVDYYTSPRKPIQ